MLNILITNDDGITAPGIAALIEVARDFGKVTVVAPDSPQSGKGHAITLTRPLRLKKARLFDGIDAYECDGTPADCVKLAKHVLFADSTIDLCLSGINHGSNSSINILYSGTMSAAMEASIEGIQSVGFSLDDFSFTADFSATKQVVRDILKSLTTASPKLGRLLNVNIPNLPIEELKGIKVCTQGNGRWVEKFQESSDPRGQKYYWLTGEFSQGEHDPNSDIEALKNGFVSVVPSGHDLTEYAALGELKFIESNY